ncbi:MAG TPA: C45 family peptidase [Conexibacter sp.]|nr:C45 family peptidase [Conexibacter sp.]
MAFAAHASTEPDPGARGHAFGVAMAVPVAGTVRTYRRLFAAISGLGVADVRQLGEQVGASLTAWPELVEEIAGIAAGAGQDERELLAINARTELLGAASRPECSFVGLLPRATAAGTTVMAQNWDWHPDLAESVVVWSIRTPDGHALTTMTEAGILAKIGLNDRGLGCCLNMLGAEGDGGVGGVPIHLLLRLVLERCATVEEALSLLLGARVTASSAISVGSDGHEPALVTVELSPAGGRCLWPDAGGVLTHTNHFLHPELQARDSAVREWPETIERHRAVCAHLATDAGPLALADLEALLRSHVNAPDAICRHELADVPYEDRDETLASVVLMLGERRMRIACGLPCMHPHRDV